jgi:hypothetical protein
MLLQVMVRYWEFAVRSVFFTPSWSANYEK